jgi:replicative DNA helicase
LNAPFAPPFSDPLQEYTPHDLQLERDVIGVALLGYPLPPWVSEHEFYAQQHRVVFRAVSELGEKACLPTVAALLRSQGRLYTRSHGPDRHSVAYRLLNSVELHEMMDSADHTMRMGWPVEFERLRELARQRRLLEAMRRVAIKLRREACGVDEALDELASATPIEGAPSSRSTSV